MTSVEDADLALVLGASAVGVNLVPSSRRFVDEVTARGIAEHVGDGERVVGVVANQDVASLREIRRRTGIALLQLHGDESPETLAALQPGAFKAIGIGGPADVRRAECYGGDRLLCDAKISGQLGGTGVLFDWSLVRDLSASRRVVLAGGLSADNVASALSEVRPWGVDVASGVERPGHPRQKDEARLRAFFDAVRSAVPGR